jgi:hypothetical protein
MSFEIIDDWKCLVAEVGLLEATRLIMAENLGQGDSVKELNNIWGDVSVSQIHAMILAEKQLERGEE